METQKLEKCVCEKMVQRGYPENHCHCKGCRAAFGFHKEPQHNQSDICGGCTEKFEQTRRNYLQNGNWCRECLKKVEANLRSKHAKARYEASLLTMRGNL